MGTAAEPAKAGLGGGRGALRGAPKPVWAPAAVYALAVAEGWSEITRRADGFRNGFDDPANPGSDVSSAAVAADAGAAKTGTAGGSRWAGTAGVADAAAEGETTEKGKSAGPACMETGECAGPSALPAAAVVDAPSAASAC
jgi:hypothetical protein